MLPPANSFVGELVLSSMPLLYSGALVSAGGTLEETFTPSGKSPCAAFAHLRVSPRATHLGAVWKWHLSTFLLGVVIPRLKGQGISHCACLGQMLLVLCAKRVWDQCPLRQPFPGSGSGDSFILLPSILGRTIHFGSFVFHILSLRRVGKGVQLSSPLSPWRRE